MEQIILEPRPAILKAKLDNLLLLEIDGKEVLCELTENQPEIRKVRVSGFDAKEVAQAAHKHITECQEREKRSKSFYSREGEA